MKRSLEISLIVQSQEGLVSFLFKKIELGLKLDQHIIIDERCWHQKLRICWLKKGDQNTYFFHKMASGRKISSFISPGMIYRLMILISDLLLIVFQIHSDRDSVEATSFTFWIGIWIFLACHHLRLLAWKSSLMKMKSFMCLWTQRWIRLLAWIDSPSASSNLFESSLKVTLLVSFICFTHLANLIIDFRIPNPLEKKGPTFLNDFRSISLLRWVHKLVAKVLTARLHLFMGSLVSHFQSAFICGHNIYNGWITTSEVVDTMKKNRQGLILNWTSRRLTIM